MKHPQSLRARLRELRCFWSWPLGHAYECFSNFDAVASRWAAGYRCLACGKAGELRLLGATPPGDRMSSPLSLFVPYQASFSRLRGKRLGPVDGDGLRVAVPGGRTVFLRYARVAFGLRAGQELYAAQLLGEEGKTAVSADLREALAEAALAEVDEPWVGRLARELSGELAG